MRLTPTIFFQKNPNSFFFNFELANNLPDQAEMVLNNRYTHSLGAGVMKDIKVAVVQMVSGTNVAENVEKMSALVKQAADTGARWVVLPEYWPLMGQDDRDKVGIAEKLGEGVLQQSLSELSAQLNMVLFAGTIPLQSTDPDKVLNTMLVYDQGKLIGQYHKMHLFGFQSANESYAEENTIMRGLEVPELKVDKIAVAQGICYDLRFPEFFRAQLPFEVMVLPAAFTFTTGKAHWQTLLSARAIENQCYVLASAQGGIHQNGRRTYGHSMIINPWGEVLACLPEGEGVITATLDANQLAMVRSKLPALNHRLL